MTYFIMNASFSEMNSVVVASAHGLVEKYDLLNETGCSREVLPLKWDKMQYQFCSSFYFL